MGKVLDEDKRGPWDAVLIDFIMILIGGMERTLTEYVELLKEAGFREVEFVQRPGCNCADAILAK